MRVHIRETVKALAEEGVLYGNVTEIGSYQVQGQVGLADMRSFFDGTYVGVDMREGPGVDVVCSVYDYCPEEKQDTVLCLETLEHISDPFLSMASMFNMLKENGVLLMTSHQNFNTHEHPSDYWRFTEFGFENLLSIFSQAIIGRMGVPVNPHTVLGLAWNGDADLESASRALNKVGYMFRVAR